MLRAFIINGYQTGSTMSGTGFLLTLCDCSSRVATRFGK